MSNCPVLAAGLVLTIVAGLFVVCAAALILLVLIQKGRGGGLSGAFAGGMASGILGSKTGDVLTWITISVVGLFLLLALALDKWWRPGVSGPEVRPSAPVTSPVTSGSEEDVNTGQSEPAE